MVRDASGNGSGDGNGKDIGNCDGRGTVAVIVMTAVTQR